MDEPETLDDHSAGLNAQEGVLGGGRVKASRLGVSEERVWPPDALQHLVANAQLVVAVVEAQPLVVPVLAEVEIHREVLRRVTPTPDR